MAVWEKSRRSRDAAGGSEQFWSSGNRANNPGAAGMKRTFLERLRGSEQLGSGLGEAGYNEQFKSNRNEESSLVKAEVNYSGYQVIMGRWQNAACKNCLAQSGPQ